MQTIQVIVTLTTSGGRTGIQNLTQPGSAITWDREFGDGDGWDQTIHARFELLKNDLVVDAFEIDGNAWREFEAEGDMRDFLHDCRIGSGLEASLRAQLDVFENHYAHDECGSSWTDTHSCGCDDECPHCGASISPHDSIMLSGLNEELPARHVVTTQS